jgi:hypothetical protein
MSTAALRPRSVTEIVDAAFQIMRAHYAQFVMCSAIAYVPWLVLELLVIGDPQREELPSLWASLVAALGIWVTFAMMSAVIVTCASQAYLGDQVDVGVAVKRVIPRLHRVMIAAIARTLALILGVFTLFIASIYFIAKYFAITPAIILEDTGVRGAFDRSTQLSMGRKWHILNTMGLVGIIYWVLAMGVAMLGTLPKIFFVQVMASAFFTILAYPVIAITETLVYYDARIRSEGLDIEMMAEELGGAPSGATTL